jgi:hypothetical protein
MAETRKTTARKSAAKKSSPRKSAAKKSARKTADDGTAKKSSGEDETRQQDADRSHSDGSNGARRAAATTESGQGHGPSAGRSGRKNSPARVAAEALEQLAALTGRPSEGVVGIERDDDEWVLEIEVLELRRIPNTTDVLARYRVTADDSGEVTGYRRLHRYVRGAAGEE